MKVILSVIKNIKANQISHYCTLQQTSKMQAWQIHSYGDLKELQLTKARIPYIEDPNDVLIKVDAASVNPIDVVMIGGYGRSTFNMLRSTNLEFPLTLGRDFAGTVIDTGHAAHKFNIGDSVYGIIPIQRQGSHAQIVLTNEAYVLKRPSHLDSVQAASLLYTAMTAWSALYFTGGLVLKKPSNLKVLVLGASGGVGTMAVQILKAQNAHVIGTCATDAVPLVRALGANNAFDYTATNFVDSVSKEGRYDIILDCAKFGHQNIPKLWKYSKYITLNSPLLVNADKYGLCSGFVTSMYDLFNANVTKILQKQSVRWGYFVASENGLNYIDDLIKHKQILPTIHKVFKFEQLPEAYKTLSDGHIRGKIVITLKN
ncbi:hypothetical protein FQA39_LY11333 [Lamprigera yunnana]|nr:hypothetical protein FQA39_LY11333 [Lamprigera yunnana]